MNSGGKKTKNKKLKLPYDPLILLLGVYPEKIIIQKGTRFPIFTAALSTYLFLGDQRASLNS